ncbi:polyamine oxidase 5 [Lecanosticta acicola]|uniref:Polyamine oxidase 5 n=1 Tax=Lecanosticta acicola TaxID=111012 RepID=A0AAI8Z6U2_9PEZI|nr:polyamine oxidase 5 [Lecanosticta acicola]
MRSPATLNDIRHVETLVIGAGISGLSCASKLFQHPFYREKDRLLVLEGRNRIGGRIESVNVCGNRLDTGANWIHGIGTDSKPNPLMKILPDKRVKQLSGSVVFKAPTADEEDEDVGDGWVRVSKSEASWNDQVIPSEIGGIISSSLWGLVGSLHELAATAPPEEAKQTTMLKAITKTDEFRSAYEKLPREYHQTFGALLQSIENMEAAPLSAQSAEQARGRAGMGLLEFAIDDFEGEQVFLQDGYTALVDEVAKDLVAADLIRLETVVKRIDWSGKPIVIETVDGNRFSADRVVSTLPLGLLQHPSSASLFQPALPSDKRGVVGSVGFGTLDKIFMVYKEPWWIEKPFSSIVEPGVVRKPFSSGSDSTKPPDSLMGFTTELPGMEIHADGSTSSGARSLSMINLHNLTGFPVLSCFVSCSTATQIESMSDAEAGGIIHRALTNWLGREPPKAEAIHVTRWAQDEFSRGSYSHMIAELTEASHRDRLAQPMINDRGAEFRFAGEHTSRDHFATVHGALLSGWREADEILKQVERVG